MAWERQLDCLQREGLHPRTLANLECNAPMGRVWLDVGKGVRLLDKSTGSYGELETTRARL